MDTHQLDTAIAELAAGKDRWAALPVEERIAYLRTVHAGVAAVAGEWVTAACAAKGIPAGSPLAGEEWISGPYAVLGWLGAITETLQAVAEGKDPLAGLPARQRPDGQTVVRVMPYDATERLLLHGFSVEVWMEPGVTPATLREHAAARYRRPAPESGKVALVLGAGNISSIAPLDVLYKLYVDGEVVILKMNPVNDYLGPILQRAFAALVDDGYVRFAYGGGDVGAYLCRHEGVGTIHITGSERTHDAIVYGAGPDGAARKARDERVLDKPVTSELGGVGGTIVVPGEWSEADFAFQAEHIATQKLHNSGFNCVASQVLVLPEAWDGTPKLLDAVRKVLAEAPARPAYYPGADDRRSAAAAEYDGAETIGGRTLICGVDSSQPKEYAFTEEFFAPALAVTTLPGNGAAEFLRNAVRFANESLHGTLGANIIIDPRTARRLGGNLEDAVAGLRYGTVAVNVWTALGYLNPRAVWGAFPGHTYDDVQSGIGVVHNALLLDKAQKTVARGPFRPSPRSLLRGEFALSPKPPWFVTNRTADTTGRRLTDLAKDGKARHLPGIFASALRG